MLGRRTLWSVLFALSLVFCPQYRAWGQGLGLGSSPVWGQVGPGGGIFSPFARRVQILTAAPACGSTTEGSIYQNTTTHDLWICNGTAFQRLTSGGTASQTLTAGTLTVTNSAEARTVWSRFDWTNAMITALGATTAGDLTVCTLPAKTVVRDAYVVIDTPDTSTNALTVALGTAATTFIDYVVASDAKAVANTVYGDATAERGTNMTIVGGHLPSITTTTAVKLHFIKTTTNLSTVTGSTGHVYLETSILP